MTRAVTLGDPEAYVHEPQVMQSYWDYVASPEQHTQQLAKPAY